MPLQPIAPNLWLLRYPLVMLGVNLGRTVTIIRLTTGKLIIHSTGPFSNEDVEAIKRLGEPAWIVEALLRHDTFAKEGRSAFPAARYLAPDRFSATTGLPAEPVIPPPAEWAEEITLVAVAGAPTFGELVMLHRPSKTLIVADLIFNFEKQPNLWTGFFLWLATVNGRYRPGMTLPYKLALKDHSAYAASLREILEWDFDRIIVGHGDPIDSDGRETLRSALRAARIQGL